MSLLRNADSEIGDRCSAVCFVGVARHQTSLCCDDIMDEFALIGPVHATKKLLDATPSREALLKRLGKAVDSVLPAHLSMSESRRLVVLVILLVVRGLVNCE